MENQVYLFPWEPLQKAAKAILLGGGSPEDEAELVAQRLVKANLTGHDSHGLIRLPQYMDRVRGGMIKPGTKTTTKVDNGSIGVYSGNSGFGQPHATEAMRRAIAKAREHNVAAVGVTDLAHIGRLADYTCMAAAEGLIGMMFTSTGGFSELVAPFGGAARRMSTNPMAVAFPSDRDFPIVMDFASSAYAEGKVRVLREARLQAPQNLLIDKDGQHTRDPNALYEGGAILPLGGPQGYKGYMLNFMMEVLGGLMTGGGFMGAKPNPPFNNCSMMICLNVSAFREPGDFKSELEALIGYLKDTPPLDGKGVMYPGEKEANFESKRRAEGIPLAQFTVEALQSEADRYGLNQALLDHGSPSADAHWEF